MVEQISIRRADNGYTLTYTKKEKKKAAGKAASSPYSLEYHSYEDCCEVFKDDEVEQMTDRIEEILNYED